jgi:hypothetical protein
LPLTHFQLTWDGLDRHTVPLERQRSRQCRLSRVHEQLPLGPNAEMETRGCAHRLLRSCRLRSRFSCHLTKLLPAHGGLEFPAPNCFKSLCFCKFLFRRFPVNTSQENALLGLFTCKYVARRRAGDDHALLGIGC